MTSSPLVSIIMPFFNAEDFILESVESIINQDYLDFELILINDGSEDDSVTIVEELASKNDKIIILNNEENIGLAASLNKGLSIASGDFIARMDADDIMDKRRIGRQVAYFSRFPEVDVLGGSLEYFGSSSYYNRFPKSHGLCQAQLCFSVCFGHPSVMFRARVFKNPYISYNETLLQYSEDYDLWCRLSFQFNFANLTDTLVRYRTYDPEHKSRAEALRRKNSRRIREEYLTMIFNDYNLDYLSLHHNISRYNVSSIDEIKEAQLYLDYLLRLESKINKSDLRIIIAKVFFELCYTNIHLGRQIHWMYLKSMRWLQYRPSFYVYVKFIFKTLFQ